MTRQLPKHLREPVGTTVADEPDDIKAIRLLAALRHFAHGRQLTLGMTIDGVEMMIIRFRPQPDGPHNPDADLTGTEL